MRALRHAACVFALAAASFLAPPANATSFSTDVSDLWYIQAESGWGMQLVQEGSTVFATLFIYDQAMQPLWAVATLQSQGVGTYTWTGTLYTTTGPYFGTVPFNPADVVATPVGQMTFQLTFVEDGVLTYTINGVTVVKDVTRQTLVYDDYNGNFDIGVHLLATSCNNPAQNGDVAGAMSLSVSQTGTAMSMVWSFLSGAVCTYNGTYGQNGKVGSFNGNYTCTTGEVGQLSMFEMTNRIGMISGRFSGGSTNIGCQYTGYFSGIDPSLPAQ